MARFNKAKVVSTALSTGLVPVFVYDKPENSKYVNAAELEYIRQVIS